MIKETGRVVAVDGQGTVWVEADRRSACAGCSARPGCGQHLLAQMGCQTQRIQAVSEQAYQVDDQVVIGIPETVLIQGALLVYLLPLAGLLAGVVLADWLTGHDLWTVLAGLLGLCLGFLGIALRSRYRGATADWQPMVLCSASGEPADLSGRTDPGSP